MGPMRSAVILTTYNRPNLVANAIKSVFEQTDQDWHLYIMDDGSNRETKVSIAGALGWDEKAADEPVGILRSDKITWWRGADRSAEERKRTISYSRSINHALNHLLQMEQYVTYLCDDDVFMPDAIKGRADFLDANQEVAVVAGRLQSIQFDKFGFNEWKNPMEPSHVQIAWEPPTGDRVVEKNGASAKTYYLDGKMNAFTDLPYVEEGFWQAGWFKYGKPFCVDHNQVMHRLSCLGARPWPVGADMEGPQIWGEDMRWGVGDKAFFTLLADVYDFYGVDVWTATKRYHSYSDGIQTGERRE